MSKNSTPTQEGLGTLERPRYFPGLLLEDEDLTAGVEYTRNLMRLLFRSLFGCGVICGLTVEGKVCGTKLTLTVNRGLALDCLGNPIEIPRSQPIEYERKCDDTFPPLYVLICYVEKCCRPRDVSCSTDDDSQFRHTRSMDGYMIQLHTKLPECACYCSSKDDMPPTPTGHGCCDEHTANGTPGAQGANATGGTEGANGTTGAAGAYATAPATPTNEQEERRRTERCDCFAKHMAAECACDCGCKCVLIAKVTVDGEKVLSDDRRRLIRPIPVGYQDCLPYTRPPKTPPAPQPTGNGPS